MMTYFIIINHPLDGSLSGNDRSVVINLINENILHKKPSDAQKVISPSFDWVSIIFWKLLTIKTVGLSTFLLKYRSQSISQSGTWGRYRSNGPVAVISDSSMDTIEATAKTSFMSTLSSGVKIGSWILIDGVRKCSLKQPDRFQKTLWSPVITIHIYISFLKPVLPSKAAWCREDLELDGDPRP